MSGPAQRVPGVSAPVLGWSAQYAFMQVVDTLLPIACVISTDIQESISSRTFEPRGRYVSILVHVAVGSL